MKIVWNVFWGVVGNVYGANNRYSRDAKLMQKKWDFSQQQTNSCCMNGELTLC